MDPGWFFVPADLDWSKGWSQVASAQRQKNISPVNLTVSRCILVSSYNRRQSAIGDPDIAQKLRMLQHFYHCDPEVKTSCSNVLADTIDILRPLKGTPDEYADATTEMSMSPTKWTPNWLPDNDDDMWDQENPRRRSFDATGWVLGPDSTSDAASKRLWPLFE